MNVILTKNKLKFIFHGTIHPYILWFNKGFDTRYYYMGVKSIGKKRITRKILDDLVPISYIIDMDREEDVSLSYEEAIKRYVV